MKKDIIRVFDDQHKLVGIKFGDKEYRIKNGEDLNNFFDRVVKDSPDFWDVYDSYEKDKNGVSAIPLELEKKSRKVKSITNKSGQTKFDKIKLAVAATVVTAVALFGLRAGKNDKQADLMNKYANTINNDTTVTTQSESLTDAQITSMDYKELKAYLNAGIQLDAVEQINAFQNNFNKIVAPSIATEEEKQQNRQLYFTANEANALYCYINAGNLTIDDYINIYGDSGLLNTDAIKDNQMQALQILHKYYARATQPSGLAELARSQEAKDLINRYESYVIAYNTATTKQEKDAARANYKEFMNEIYNDRFNIDSMAESETEGALSYVLEASAIYGASNQMFAGEEEYTRYWEYAKTVSCDDVLNMKIKEAAEKVKRNETARMVVNEQTGEASYDTKTTNDKIMERVPGALDEQNIDSSIESREIEIVYNRAEESSYRNETTSTSNSSATVISTTPTESTVISTTPTPVEVTREEAVEIAGETEVEHKEQQAQEQVNIENQKEEARALGYQAAYNQSYETAYMEAFNSGRAVAAGEIDTASLIAVYTGAYADSYKQGIQQGIAAGIAAGSNDGSADRAKAEEILNAQLAAAQVEETEAYALEDDSEIIIDEMAPVARR